MTGPVRKVAAILLCFPVS